MISRAAGDERDIMKQSVRSNMERQLEKIMPKDRAGAYNQALMELGATVCLPNGEPKCKECPWQEVCIAGKEGKTNLLPVKTRQAKRKIQKRTVFMIRDGEKVILRRRPGTGLLAGMYEFPNEIGHLNAEEAVSYVKEMHLMPLHVERLADARHVFSHVEWHMAGYLIRVEELEEENQKLLFAETADFKDKYPMPSAFGAYMELLNVPFGKDRFQKEKSGSGYQNE